MTRPLTDREARVLAYYQCMGVPLRTWRMAQALGIPASEARRIAHRLAARRLLERSPMGRFPTYAVAGDAKW